MKKKSLFLYLLVFISAILVFTFLLFPKNELAAYLSNSLTNSALRLSIETVKPRIPFKLNLVNARLTIDQSVEIVPESLTLQFKPTFIFNQNQPIRFYSDFYQGSLNGSLLFEKFTPLLLSQMDLTISEVKINDFKYKTDLADINLACKLNGQYAYSENGDGEQSSHGTVSIQDFSVILKDSFFNTLNIPVVKFLDIKAEFTQLNNVITVKHIIAKGSYINIELEGRIDIKTPLQTSKLNFKGVINPDSRYLSKFANVKNIKSTAKNISKNGIKFNLNGTLNNPEIGL